MNEPKMIKRETHDAILKGVILQHELHTNDIITGFQVALSATKESSEATSENNQILAKKLATALVTIKTLKKKIRNMKK